MWPSRQLVVVGCILLLAGVLSLAMSMRSLVHVIDAGFWFEPLTYDASEQMADRLGAAITGDEMKTIAAVASSEITGAFTGLRIRFSDRRDATYRVQVVQRLQPPTLRGYPAPSGESRSITGIGGRGAVNFSMLANRAIAYAPADVDRATIIAAIGRGVGRAAVHEFAHQFLGAALFHHTKDRSSYDYPSADRHEQYYGEMHWDIAGPLLQERFR